MGLLMHTPVSLLEVRADIAGALELLNSGTQREEAFVTLRESLGWIWLVPHCTNRSLKLTGRTSSRTTGFCRKSQAELSGGSQGSWLFLGAAKTGKGGSRP